MAKEPLKTIDIQKDYPMYLTLSILRTQLHLICSYMQSKTPYGKAYEAAYNQHLKLLKQIDKYESLLQTCLEEKGSE